MNVSIKHEELFEYVDQILLSKFINWHKKNPMVYENFKMLSYELLKAGRTKYSAWAIINKIRWDHDLSTTGDEFKISNDFIALYARLLIFEQPDSFKNFFKLKKMKRKGRKYQGKDDIPSIEVI